jgi:RHS repeat-associated protein
VVPDVGEGLRIQWSLRVADGAESGAEPLQGLLVRRRGLHLVRSEEGEMADERGLRQEAVRRHLGGEDAACIAADLGRSERWVYKWVARYEAAAREDWFVPRSRRPGRSPGATPETVVAQVLAARDRLEVDPRAQRSAAAIAWELLSMGVAEAAVGGQQDEETWGYNANGQLVRAENSAATVSIAYNDDGQVATVTEGSDVTTVTYDQATGRVASVTGPNGTTSYTYEANGLIQTIADPVSGSVVSLTRDQAGRVATRSGPGSLLWTWGYDATSGLPTSLLIEGSGGSDLARFDATYDPAGNVVSALEWQAGRSGNGTWGLTYDAAGRLTRAVDPGGTATSYGYEGAGNRVSVQVGSQPAVTTAYDPAGLPLSSSDGTQYQHDAAGRLTSITGGSRSWTFESDGWGRLTRAVSPATSATYGYDALGRLRQRQEGGATRTYSYIGASPQVAAETTGSATTLYGYWPGGPVSQRSGTSQRSYLIDMRHSVVGMVDPSDTITATASYSPWGERVTVSGETMGLGFRGLLTDQDTGLSLFGGRSYDPQLGRFLSASARVAESGQNLYAFGENNPVETVQPSLVRVVVPPAPSTFVSGPALPIPLGGGGATRPSDPAGPQPVGGLEPRVPTGPDLLRQAGAQWVTCVPSSIVVYYDEEHWLHATARVYVTCTYPIDAVYPHFWEWTSEVTGYQLKFETEKPVRGPQAFWATDSDIRIGWKYRRFVVYTFWPLIYTTPAFSAPGSVWRGHI